MGGVAADLVRQGQALPTQVQRGGRRLDIQGLRAVAVLMVVAFHAGLPVPGGFVGVDVFFVLSGFVITAMLQREWRDSGRINFTNFYMRRFKRLTPALALTVAVTMLVTMLVVSPVGPQQTAAKTAIGAMLLSSNVVIGITTGDYFGAAAETNPLLNMWSLSVEEQFYLGFPLLLALGWMLARRGSVAKAIPWILVAFVAVASFGFALVDATNLTFKGAGALLGFYSPLTRAWEFALGALLALAAPILARPTSRTSLIMALAGSAGLAASLWLIGAGTPFPGLWTLLPVGATLLLLQAGHGSNAVTRALASSPMVRVGDWSYSIYLWHWPVIVFATSLWPDRSWVPLLAAGLSFFPALASYHWLEQPIRNGTFVGWRFVRLLTFVVVPPLALAAVVYVAATQGYGSPVVREYLAASKQHVGNASGCHTGVPISERSVEKCQWNGSAEGAPIYLVGDSHGDQFSEAIVGAANMLGRPATVTTLNNCPFFGAAIEKVNDRNAIYRYCDSFYPATMQWLARQQPGVVVIATTDSPYGDSTVRLGLEGGATSLDPEAKLRSMVAGMTETVSALQMAGHRVVLVQDTPAFGGEHDYEPTECTLVEILGGACVEVLPFESVDVRQAPARAALREIAATTGATVLDVRDQFCSAEGCPSRSDEMILYRDRGHISVSASKSLADEFARAIEAAG